MKKKMTTAQNTIALVYDYDQTLSPVYMQNDVIFPEFGIQQEQFWQKCNELVQSAGWDNELAYMKSLQDYLAMDQVTNQQLRKLGEGLSFFPGLPEYFSEVRAVLEQEHLLAGIHIEHYIISSGLKELIDGSRLAPFMKAIFACEYGEDEFGRIVFPKRTISHTEKTQYLYRINKGMLKEGDDVNDYVPHELRPIPFKNMIYVGDGPTDIPAFKLTTRNGGRSVAVYNPADKTRKSFRKSYQLSVSTDRVGNIAPADYREGSHLRLILEEMVKEIADRILKTQRDNRDNSTVSAPSY